MSLNAIRENKIIAKISRFTVMSYFVLSESKECLCPFINIIETMPIIILLWFLFIQQRNSMELLSLI